jgi:hypothetical protein
MSLIAHPNKINTYLSYFWNCFFQSSRISLSIVCGLHILASFFYSALHTNELEVPTQKHLMGAKIQQLDKLRYIGRQWLGHLVKFALCLDPTYHQEKFSLGLDGG